MANRADRRRQKKLAKKGPPVPPPEFDPQMHQALALHQAGELDRAMEIYRQVLNAAPDHVHALHLLGAAAHQLGQHEDAIGLFAQALSLAPSFPEARNNLASAFVAVGRYEDALAAATRAVKEAPELPNARRVRATALLRLGRFEKAISDLKAVIKMVPNDAESHNDLGAALYATGDLEDALAAYAGATALAPDLAEAHNNQGSALNDLGRPDEALSLLETAVELKPDYADAWVNLGNARLALGRRDTAREAFESALTLQGEHPQAHLNRGLILLTEGDFEGGWPEYEWRWKTPDMLAGDQFGEHPRWDGRPLNGETILLHAEQGLGDTLQFVRFADEIQRRGGRVVLQCQEPLHGLLSSFSAIAEIVGTDVTPPPFDYQAPLLALPGIFGTNLNNIPLSQGYIETPAPAQLEPADGPSVGLVWRGNPGHRNDRNRSFSGEELHALVDQSGVSFHCLQFGDAAEELLNAPWATGIIDQRPNIVGFQNTSSVVAALDLIITVDTSMAHLAGAMGRPVWTLLSTQSDWRWLLDRDDSPWYSSMRLFRQTDAGDWGPVLNDIGKALRDWTSGSPSTI